MVADFVVAGLVVQAGPGPVARQVHADGFGDAGIGARAHQQDAVRQQDRFVHVVRDHEYGLAGFLDNAAQLILDGAAGQRVQRTERLVHQHRLGLRDEGARQCGALAHAARHLMGVIVFKAAQADPGQPMARGLAGALLGRVLEFEG
ncbi:hypothetical protein G6F31_014383 [Rhizopus arrhizus]|nr:hypothetical protein G6F31_014383 [Rhizopus arrhizus]